MNHIALARLALFFAIGFAAAGEQGLAASFLIGIVASAALTAPMYARLIVDRYGLSGWHYFSPLARIAGLGLVLAIGWQFIEPRPTAGVNYVWLVARFLVSCAIYWLMCYALLLSKSERAELHHVIRRVSDMVGVRIGQPRKSTNA